MLSFDFCGFCGGKTNTVPSGCHKRHAIRIGSKNTTDNFSGANMNKTLVLNDFKNTQ